MKALLAVAAAFLCITGISQSVGINATGAVPNPSAILDVSSTTKGVVLPRMSMSERDLIGSPLTGLIIYQTDFTPGYYVNAGTPAAPLWVAMSTAKNAWSVTGNAGTNPAQNFVGTSDFADLHFRVNNQNAGYIGLGGSNFYGFRAGWLNTADANTGFGYEALYTVSNTNYNTAFGKFSLRASTGSGNTAMGYNSLVVNKSGNNNVAIGYNSMSESVYSLEAVAVGAEALKRNSNSNTPFGNDGRYNTAIGTRALTYNTSGNSNTATGWQSLRDNNGNFNTANGMQSLILNITGSHNTGMGAYSLFSNNTGNNNTAVGSYALLEATTISDNTAVGYEALRNTIQSNNTALGTQAGLNNTGGDGNTFVGAYSGMNNVSGRLNVAIGRYALNTNVNGQQNTALGAGAEIGYDGISNATSIGAFSRVDCSNCMVLGSIATISPLGSNTNVGIGLTSPTARLNIRSNSTVTTDKQLLLEENENDYVRIGFKNTTSPNYWDIAAFAAGDVSSSRINFYFSPGGDALSLFGNGNATLKGTLTQLSDKRLKTNILPLSSTLAAITQLSGYSYNWKDETSDKQLQYGLMAQEVQQLFPELVKENDKGFLGVNYIGLIPVMITAIKEQQEQINKQSEMINALMKKLENIAGK